MSLLRRKNKARLKRRCKTQKRRSSFLSVKILNIFVLVVIVFSGILYLANINDIAIKGFKIKELDEKESELVEKIKKAEYEVAELPVLWK